MRAWTKEEYEYLKTIYQERFNKDIASIMNKHFKGKYRVYTEGSISCAKDRYKLHSKPQFGTLYTKEVIEFIQNNYEGKDNIELAELLNKKFNLNTNAKKITMFKSNLKRRFGIDVQTGINRGCFKKGNVPINKGTKGMFNVGGNATSFKKGNIPFNHREIGEERITKDGYIEIKIKDGCLNDNWQLKHRYIYEQHYGKIPDGYNIIFLDGNRQNLDINNLKAVSKAEDLIMNQNNFFTNDKEITNTGVLIAKVIDKGNKLKNEKKERL